MTSDQGPPGAAACWDWSHNALGRRVIGGNVLFFFLPCTARVGGREDGSFSVKEEEGGEDSSAFFWGSEWRGPVWVCVYVGEYKWASSHGTGSRANYFFLGKHLRKERETEEEGGRDERRSNFAFLFPLIHHRAELCVAAVCEETAAEDSLVSLLWWKEMMYWHTHTRTQTHWSVLEQHKDSHPLTARDLWALCTLKLFPPGTQLETQQQW